MVKKAFQLTRSRGAWLSTTIFNTTALAFQLTRSRGAWPVSGIWDVVKDVFQLTRSRGAWRQPPGRAARPCGHFNSHAHVERDAAIATIELPQILFQLTRSRGAWRGISPNFSFIQFISTHTLTWSVTLWNEWYYNFIVISTHTLTWSVTLAGSHGEIFNFHFNSHAHVERDSTNKHRQTKRHHFNSHAHVERDTWHHVL